VAVVGAALALSVAFGAGDQYLGSLSWQPWAADVSLLSAPWLVLPFLAGWTQRAPRGAALLGLGCTLAAWLGYGLMTLSPVEGAQLSVTTMTGFVRSERLWIAGALLTGPLFGVLGQRWRARGSWLGALGTAAAVMLEPLVRRLSGVYAIRFRSVELAEVAVGLGLALSVVAATRLRQRRL
jgi:hypothetical protein